MVLYLKFAYGSQFSGEKKTVFKPVTFTSYANSWIQENSCVFFKRPVEEWNGKWKNVAKTNVDWTNITIVVGIQGVSKKTHEFSCIRELA